MKTLEQDNQHTSLSIISPDQYPRVRQRNYVTFPLVKEVVINYNCLSDGKFYNHWLSSAPDISLLSCER